jgi:hypothetical protein
VEVQLHAFLISALDGKEWLASRSGYFSPGERAPGTYWIRGWVGPRVSLEAVEKTHFPCWELNPDLLATSLIYS